MGIDDLYRYAEENGIVVEDFIMSYAESVSLPVGDGMIAINPCMIRSTADEKVKLAHEIGHCETLSFYNRYSPCDIVARHENRADRFAIKKLVPKDELDAAVADGRTEIWELAETFGVTEDFMRKTVKWYQQGTIGGY